MRRLIILTLLLFFTCNSIALAAESIEAQLNYVVDETRKTLPMMIGENIQATNVGSSGKTLINYYHFTKQKFEFYNLPAIIDKYRRNSIIAACTNPDTMKFIVKSGGSIQYRFYDSDNVFVEKFTIDSKTCRRL
jgi:hypothetical protein